jgi:hypothetical protein
MREAIPPSPNTPSWRGAQLNHRDNFTFTFTLSNSEFEQYRFNYRILQKNNEIENKFMPD